MNNINLVQKYLANLAVLNIKLHNIHWNVVGKQFMQVHNFTEEIYGVLFDNLDEVAELLKMKDILPLASMEEYLGHTDIEEILPRDFSVTESLELIRSDFENMKSLAIEIRNTSDDGGDFETLAIFETYISNYSKNIWFLNSMLK